MAKQSKFPPEGAGRIKFRVIEFEIDGSDTSLQESLKSLTAALARGTTASPPSRTRLVAPAAEEVGEEGGEVEEVEEVEETEDVQPRSSARRGPAAPRKLPQVKFLQDLRTDNVKPTLREFATAKAPDNEISKYIAIAYWFKYHGGLDEITLDHFFTAYKHIGVWQTPKDPNGPIRDAKHKRRVWLTGGKTTGTVSITYAGERVVDAMGSAG